MSYSAKILLDSLSPENIRLTTMEVTFPRFVHSELMTHRVFSRNAASSRAIPVSKSIERVKKDPVEPIYWGQNQSGMQATQELSGEDKERAKDEWHYLRRRAVAVAEDLVEIGVHKQIANRLLEPFSWITVIITATEWDNFFKLRCHPAAQPEIRQIASMMQGLYVEHQPTRLGYGQWHLPLIDEEDVRIMDADIKSKQGDVGEIYTYEALKSISAARCARISYLTHDGKRDHSKDLELHARLISDGHWSPLEHVARPIQDYFDAQFTDRDGNFWSGNFRGWRQYRKDFEEKVS